MPSTYPSLICGFLSLMAWAAEPTPVATHPRQAPLLALQAFDGRIYAQPAQSNHGVDIFSYSPDALEWRRELALPDVRAGRHYRLLDARLILPIAGGYCASAGNGAWERVELPDAADLLFEDATLHEGRFFLAGGGPDGACVAWRDGDGPWKIEKLWEQATRFSPRAVTFLQTPRHLSLLASRHPKDPPRTFIAEWGAWYLLHYVPKGSDRGFLFDALPRPLPVLNALAPGSALPRNPQALISRAVRWGNDQLLYLIAIGDGTMIDEQGGLYLADLATGDPQTGTTFFGKRLAGMELARDIKVVDGWCHLLLAANTARTGSIVRSRDLETWETLYAGDFAAPPLSLAILDGVCHVGLDNGTLLRLEP